MSERTRAMATMRGHAPPANIMGPQLRRLVLQALDGFADADAARTALDSALARAGLAEVPDTVEHIAEFALGPLRATIDQELGAQAASDLLKALTPLIKRACDYETAVEKRGEDQGQATDEGTPRSVLVVDGDLDVRTRIAQVLRGRGFGVVTAADGNVALVVCLRRRPDVVVVATDAQGIGGGQLATLLRAAFGGESPAVVLLGESPAAAGDEPPLGAVLDRAPSDEALLGAVQRVLR